MSSARIDRSTFGLTLARDRMLLNSSTTLLSSTGLSYWFLDGWFGDAESLLIKTGFCDRNTVSGTFVDVNGNKCYHRIRTTPYVTFRLPAGSLKGYSLAMFEGDVIRRLGDAYSHKYNKQLTIKTSFVKAKTFHEYSDQEESFLKVEFENFKVYNDVINLPQLTGNHGASKYLDLLLLDGEVELMGQKLSLAIDINQFNYDASIKNGTLFLKDLIHDNPPLSSYYLKIIADKVAEAKDLGVVAKNITNSTVQKNRLITMTWDMETYNDVFPENCQMDENEKNHCPISGMVIISYAIYVGDVKDPSFVGVISRCPFAPRGLVERVRKSYPNCMIEIDIVKDNRAIDMVKHMIDALCRFSPDIMSGFNDSFFDWPYFLTRLSNSTDASLKNKFWSSMNGGNETTINRIRNASFGESIRVTAANFTKTTKQPVHLDENYSVKIPGDINKQVGKIPSATSTLCFDTRALLRQIHPSTPKSSLNFFLGMCKLDQKEPMPMEHMLSVFRTFKITQSEWIEETLEPVSEEEFDDATIQVWYDDIRISLDSRVVRVTPVKPTAAAREMMAAAGVNPDAHDRDDQFIDSAFYCVIDSVRVWDLIRSENIISERIKKAELCRTSLADSFSKANGFMLKSLISGYGKLCRNERFDENRSVATNTLRRIEYLLKNTEFYKSVGFKPISIPDILPSYILSDKHVGTTNSTIVLTEHGQAIVHDIIDKLVILNDKMDKANIVATELRNWYLRLFGFGRFFMIPNNSYCNISYLTHCYNDMEVGIIQISAADVKLYEKQMKLFPTDTVIKILNTDKNISLPECSVEWIHKYFASDHYEKFDVSISGKCTLAALASYVSGWDGETLSMKHPGVSADTDLTTYVAHLKTHEFEYLNTFTKSYKGAYVQDPIVGLKLNTPIVGLDFSSLYPSIINAMNFSQDALLPWGGETNKDSLEPMNNDYQTDLTTELSNGLVIPREKHRTFRLPMYGDFVEADDEPPEEEDEEEEDMVPSKKTIDSPIDVSDMVIRNSSGKKYIRASYVHKDENPLKYFDSDKHPVFHTPLDFRQEHPLRQSFDFIGHKYFSVNRDTEGLIPFILKDLTKLRKQEKKIYESSKHEIEQITAAKGEVPEDLIQIRTDSNLKQLAIKVMMNSIYGLMGSETSGFLYFRGFAEAITSVGRMLLRSMINMVQSDPEFMVHYGDTDSMYISLRPLYPGLIEIEQTASSPEELANRKIDLTRDKIKVLAVHVNQVLATITKSNYLSMAYEEVLYPLMMLSKKHYMGIPHENVNIPISVDSNSLKLKSLFVRGGPLVKRSTTEYVIDLFLSNVLNKLFSYETIDKYHAALRHMKETYPNKAISLLDKLSIERVITPLIFEMVKDIQIPSVEHFVKQSKLNRKAAATSQSAKLAVALDELYELELNKPRYSSIFVPPNDGETFPTVVLEDAPFADDRKLPTAVRRSVSYRTVHYRLLEFFPEFKLDMDRYVLNDSASIISQFIPISALYSLPDKLQMIEDQIPDTRPTKVIEFINCIRFLYGRRDTLHELNPELDIYTIVQSTKTKSSSKKTSDLDLNAALANIDVKEQYQALRRILESTAQSILDKLFVKDGAVSKEWKTKAITSPMLNSLTDIDMSSYADIMWGDELRSDRDYIKTVAKCKQIVYVNEFRKSALQLFLDNIRILNISLISKQDYSNQLRYVNQCAELLCAIFTIVKV